MSHALRVRREHPVALGGTGHDAPVIPLALAHQFGDGHLHRVREPEEQVERDCARPPVE
jgi:hypothetical protein